LPAPTKISVRQLRNPGKPPASQTKTRRKGASGGCNPAHDAPIERGYFCHVRFLWRFDFKRFRRLCLFIFRRRFFFRLPMV
jgi:hypothetical protein